MKELQFEPPLIAHRGASAFAPENTLASFTKAVQLKANWIEFDVQEAACGELVVFHDETLDRTTNGKGKLDHYPYTHLKTLDAGSWFDPIFAGEHIPTLAEALSFICDHGISANIELKAAIAGNQFIKRVRELITYYQPQSTLLFSSFDWTLLAQLRQTDPHCLIALLMEEYDSRWSSFYQSLNCNALSLNYKLVNDQNMSKFKELIKPILLSYTINDRNLAKLQFKYGINAIFTDQPNLLT